ncbi:MAG: AgmX/PglI C-terminal domain-containing protein [Pseudomonadota bacterium]
MAECPFCKSSIEDELARFGGHCPKCFIEIPGDETPTDPGLAKRVAQQLEHERQRPWGRVAGIAAMAAVVLIAAGGVVVWRVLQQPGATAQAAEQDLETFYIAPASDHRLPEVGSTEPEDQGAATVQSHQRGTGSVEAVEVGSRSRSGPARYDFTGSAEVSTPDLAPIAQRTVEVGPGAIEQSTTGFPPQRVEITRSSVESMALSDPEEIHQAVGTALKSYSGQLNHCYNIRLKTAPDLRGSWDIAFSITEAGRPRNISVQGLQAHDPEFETCMRDAISRWTFQPLAIEQDFSKTYSFEPLR